MRLLGFIKKIDGKPRTWTNSNGDTVYSFKMAFEAEGNQFLGEYTINPQRLAQNGIRPGAVGYMDIKFSIRDYTSKTTGETMNVQDIRFSKWSLANQNTLADQPAPSAAPEQAQPEASAEEVAAGMAEAAAQAEEAGAGIDLPF